MRRARNRIPGALWALAAILLALAPFVRARVESEIVPPDKRRVSVENAIRIAKMGKPEALPVALSLPFAPPGFDLTDAEEAAAAAAANAQAGRANPSTPPPPTDRQLFEEIANKIRPSGTSVFNGKPLLMIGNKFVKTGSHFTVTYKGNDYDLELTQIDGSNFTLRYKSEEITRPIKTGKPQ
jgi:hypothetical protein